MSNSSITRPSSSGPGRVACRAERGIRPASLASLVLLVSVALGAGACTNPSTPAGHEGYVYHVPLVVGKAEYRESLRGPASTGAAWRLYVTNIDMRMRSYKEEFTLLTRDNLTVSFEVNTRMGLRPGTVREIVERWGAQSWYKWNVKEPLRTTVRRRVTQVSAIDIQLKTNAVRESIQEQLLAKYKKTPIRIDSVDIGNIQFPRKVTKAIERKIGQQQELERQEYMLAKTRKEAAIRVLESLKAAKQQIIISATLGPLYIQRMAVQVYRTLAKSGNKTVLMLPNTTTGTGLPLVLSSDVVKTLSAKDRQFLDRMEKKYMRQARKATIPAEPSSIPGGKPIQPPGPGDEVPGGQDGAGGAAAPGMEPPARPEEGAAPAAPIERQPPAGQPGMGQPGMGQPGMSQPGMGQPGMAAPAMRPQ